MVWETNHNPLLLSLQSYRCRRTTIWTTKMVTVLRWCDSCHISNIALRIRSDIEWGERFGKWDVSFVCFTWSTKAVHLTPTTTQLVSKFIRFIRSSSGEKGRISKNMCKIVIFDRTCWSTVELPKLRNLHFWCQIYTALLTHTTTSYPKLFRVTLPEIS